MSIKIYGAGMAAYAAKLAFPNSIVFANKAVCKHYRIKSQWREEPIIYNSGTHGMSAFYHGVSPVDLFHDSENKIPLTYLGIWFDIKTLNIKHGYFVPLKVPRPKIKKYEYFNDIKLKDTDVVFLCMSVVGNLKYLIGEGYIKEAKIGDDLVYKIGTINTNEYNNVINKYAIRVKKGSIFPIIKFNNKIISFRPIFIKETNLNFIDLNQNFSLFNFNLLDIIEKILSAIYLRFGLLLYPVKKWACYVQDYIDDAYEINANGVYESALLHQKYLNSKISTSELLKNLFRDFNEEEGFVISGIHLRYDREILKNIPLNLHVFDNSLSNNYGEHPTIIMFCCAYKYAISLAKKLGI